MASRTSRDGLLAVSNNASNRSALSVYKDKNKISYDQSEIGPEESDPNGLAGFKT